MLFLCYNLIMEQLINITRLHPITKSVSIEYKHVHTHDFWEIVLLIKGKNYTQADKSTLEMHAHDIIILPHKIAHRYDIKSKPYEHRDIYISDSDMRALCAAIDKDLYSSLLEDPCYIFRMKDEVLFDINNRLKMIETILPINLTANEVNIAKTIVTYILGLRLESKGKNSNDYPEWVKKLMDEMQNPSVMQENLDYFARITSYSPEHLCRQFKKITGRGLNEYFVEVKMRHAASLLTSTDYSITDIANEVGYDSVSYFIKCFKKHYGKTPLEYKKFNS